MSSAAEVHAEPANRILVIRARHDWFDRMPYAMHLLAEEWRRRGIPVEVSDALPEPTGPDVLVFPHLDLTIMPPPFLERLKACARVINRSVADISKRAISRHLVASPDEYEGEVIVKTNLNFGGKPEMRILVSRGGEAFERFRETWGDPWYVSGLLVPEKYPIFENPRLIPAEVWDHPRLVVEKFLPEREGDLYCLRQYVFLGQSEFNTRSVSADPRVKSVGVVRREVLDATPPAVREFREKLGFDYGKFDYVMHGDEAIVFDVNRTFSYNPKSEAGSASPMITKLADGIGPFMGKD